MTTPTRHLTAPAAGRFDKVLAALAPDLSRARLQKLIADGHVKINGKTVTAPSAKLKGGEEISFTVPEAADPVPQAETIALDVVFEDKDLLVLNKPPGLVVHPAAGNHTHTLVNALLAHCGKSLSGIGGVKRPGIVHRLDKDTSGLMVVAKNDAAHHGLSAQFADHSLSRRYEAFVWGVPLKKTGTIDTLLGRSPVNRKKMAVLSSRSMKEKFIGDDIDEMSDLPDRKSRGKQAITHYEVLEIFGTVAARLSCTLETGRTHQIRVHLAHLGHSVIGDPLYGNARGHKKIVAPEKAEAILAFPRQALHAAEITFTHPVTAKEIHKKSALPEDMKELLKLLRKL